MNAFSRGIGIGIFLLMLSGAAAAGDGALDPTFGVGGTLTAPGNLKISNYLTPAASIRNHASAVAVDGSFYLASQLDNGIAVSKFDRDGVFYANWQFQPGFYFTNYQMFVRADGKLIIAGDIRRTVNGNLELGLVACRLNPGGTPDLSFGSSLTPGCSIVSDEWGDQIHSISVIQPDGKIVIAAVKLDNPNNSYTGHTVIVRLTTSGALDSEFGPNHDGRLVLDDTPYRYSDWYGAAIGRDGKLVFVGGASRDEPFVKINFVVLRVDGAGLLDTSFDASGQTPGRKLFALNGNSNKNNFAKAVQVLPDGSILVAGTVYFNYMGADVNQFAVAKLTPAGAFDTTFNPAAGMEAGKFLLIFGNMSVLHDMAVQSDGGILLAGSTIASTGTYENFGVMRLKAGGTIDQSFGASGRVTLPFDLYMGNSIDIATDMLIQSGRPLVFGAVQLENGTNSFKFGVTRLESDLIFRDGLGN